MEAWRGAHARAGREEEARAYFEEDMKMFGPLGVGRNLSDEQIAALTDPSKVHSGVLPTLEMAVEGGGWLCGPPGLITEKIMEIQERYPGLEAMNIGSVIGVPEKVLLEQLERFGKEVMPKFKDKVEVPAAVGN